MNLEELLAMNSDDLTPPQDHGVPGDDGLLQRNLAALRLRNPAEADRIGSSQCRGDLRFLESEEGISATIGGIALASKRRPVSEGRKLAGSFDREELAIAGVIGFGLGYHCGSLVEHLGEWGLVVCYEPDLGLLRGVLERIDCTEMFKSGRFMLVCDPDDSARCNQAFAGNEALVGMGVRLIAHPPSTGRLVSTSERFGQTFTNALRATRTHVVTTLANSRTTLRNALMNTDHYVRNAGIRGLKDSCAGKPAIVVSAGPSLEKNIELLREPGVRDRFVIIAVQTVLKPMLAKGIKPHFVAALDYHEVSGRFYEGLSEEDVRGVRLIAEAKANPVILDSFPGEVICPGDELLDRLLGERLHRDRGSLPMGATVAHLCYNFARYLGCDPVILIGQDLGFSDGQYYSNGAAIHTVWGSELSAHRSIEMLEWERIARMRAHLQEREDIHGKAIYSDEQMCSYLAMFEQMFEKDSASGLTIIDASEGGVRKAHTRVMPLREAIDAVEATPTGLAEGTGEKSCERISEGVFERIGSLVDDAIRIAHLSEQSGALLREMLDQQDKQQRVDKLIDRINANRDEVMGMADAFHLIESVNQVAVLNRLKRDRVIKLRSSDASAKEKQRLQIERDVENVRWTRDAAHSVADQLRYMLDVLRGQKPKVTTEQSAPAETNPDQRHDAQRANVHAFVLADPARGGMGTERDLSATILPDSAGGLNVLQATIARISASAQIDGITIISPEPDRAKALIGEMSTTREVRIVGVDPDLIREHTTRVGTARMRSSSSWRGSMGMLCAYDEAAHPGIFADIMEAGGIDAAAIVGGDWAMVDPSLIDETVARFRGLTSDKRIAFSQAAPGLGTMVIDRETMVSLRDSGELNGRRNHFATLGALISYLPTAPQADPIVRGVCVQIQPELRDIGVRAIADSTQRIDAIQAAYASINNPLQADALMCAQELRETTRVHMPRTLVLETCTGRLVSGPWGDWKRASKEIAERRPIEMNAAHRLLRELATSRDDACVVFDGVGDPLMHPGALDLVALAKEDGVACVELRTDLLRDGIAPDDLIESGVDILSVDVIADDRALYERLAGVDGYERVFDRLQSIYDASAESPLWLAARMTRCEQTLDQIESFYDRWLLLTGCAIIDPPPASARDQRIRAMDIPGWRRAQMERETMRVRCDGVVVDANGRAILAQGSEINAIEEGIERAYQRMRSAVRASALEIKPNAEEYAA
jgi:hypothetical protein